MTWTDHAEAAVLREALVARGIEDVLLVSELHAAAALAQAIGRAVGYDKTALMFVERDTATLAVVETVDGSVVKVLSAKSARWRCNRRGGRDGHRPGRPGISGPWPVRRRLRRGRHRGQGTFEDLVSVPVIAPEEPQLALARGAALASANAPRYDTSTIGLAYSQDPEGTTAQSISVADVVGHDDACPDAADVVSEPDDVPERSKPFLLVGSSLTAIFIAGMLALTIAVVVNVRPTADQRSDDHDGASRHCSAASRGAQCAAYRGEAGAYDGPCPRSSGTTTCAHRHGTAQGSARPAAASGGAQRRARARGAATPCVSRSTPARCGSAGDPAATGHTVAGTVASTDSSAAPLLQPAAAKPAGLPGSEGSLVRRPRWFPPRAR